MEQNLKQMQDEKFEWFNPRYKSAGSRGSKDISISLTSVGKKGAYHDGISFVFRNGVEKKIGMNLEMAIFKNRILFREADEPAMTLFANKESKNIYAKVHAGAQVQTLKKFIGDYDLKHDDFYELYYIEREES